MFPTFRQLAKSSGFSATALIVLAIAVPARATYSIVACDAVTGQCGVAVQTDNLAVGASVPYAQAGVGAIASQFETNPRHGPRGVALLAEGKSAAEVLAQLLREDGNFEGRGIEARQVAVVSANGKAAVHTGTDVAKADWAGSRSGDGFSIQGNGLAGPQVIEAMEKAFLTTNGSLADRLLAALCAGDRSGGQRTGRESAALLVRTREGFPLDTDLRVDHADDPVGQLRFLFGLQTARQQLIQARIAGRHGNRDDAKLLLISAAARATTWPRACILAAEVAVEIEQPALATQYLTLAFDRNPARIPIILGDGTFSSLGRDPAFHRWIGPALEQSTLADYQRIIAAKEPSLSDRLSLARRLLETGYTAEAQTLLEKIPEQSPDVFLLNATVLEANGSLLAAIEQCRAGLRASPDDVRLKFRMARLQQSPSVASHATGNITPDLSHVADPLVWRVQNRHATFGDENGRKAVRLDASADDGMAWLVGSNFSEGTIEVDLRGHNRPGQSFVGIALHGRDDTVYEVVYFRPFNFANPEISHRARAVQYVSMPDFPWEKLRADSPGKYESTVTPAPDPNDWFHARIVVEGRNIRVFVNDSPLPSLVATELGERRDGLLGLWVGNGSDGAFANLKISPQTK